MPHDIFISHTAKDKIFADGVCAKLEQRGIRCWIAPRDVPPGQSWPAAIASAIDNCKVMVLVFSVEVMSSQQVERELTMAANRNKIIMPLRIQDVLPVGAFAYYLEDRHWLDAITPPVEKHIDELADILLPLIGGVSAPVAPLPPVVAPETPTNPTSPATAAAPPLRSPVRPTRKPLRRSVAVTPVPPQQAVEPAGARDPAQPAVEQVIPDYSPAVEPSKPSTPYDEVDTGPIAAEPVDETTVVDSATADATSASDVIAPSSPEAENTTADILASPSEAQAVADAGPQLVDQEEAQESVADSTAPDETALSGESYEAEATLGEAPEIDYAQPPAWTSAVTPAVGAVSTAEPTPTTPPAKTRRRTIQKAAIAVAAVLALLIVAAVISTVLKYPSPALTLNAEPGVSAEDVTPMSAIAFTADGTKLYTAIDAGDDSTGPSATQAIAWWDPATGKRGKSYSDSNTIKSISTAAKGVTAIADSAGLIQIIGAPYEEPLFGNSPLDVQTISPNDGASIPSVALSPDGRVCVALCDNNVIKAYDTTDDSLIYKASFPGPGNATCLAYCATGNVFVVGGGGPATVYDGKTGKILRTISANEEADTIAVSPDGSTIASMTNYGLRVSNFVTGQSMSDTTIPWFVDQLCFSPDSKSVAIATEEGGVIIQNLANGTQKRIGIFGGFESNPVGLLHGHLTNDLEANSVAFSPDGKRIAAACEDGKARVWNIN
jgi:hypothetical protein